MIKPKATRPSGGFLSQEATLDSRHMHELSVCQALLAQVREIARAHGASAVKQVIVAAGPLSGVEPALLERAFMLARAGGCAAQAELKFEPIPISVRCTECGAESACEANCLLCTACGGYRTQLLSGDELRLLRVELSLSEQQDQSSRHLNG
jgi:hydrogenase nickel incorporation protein HypA/HybF